MNTNIKKFETKLLRNGYSSQGAISASKNLAELRSSDLVKAASVWLNNEDTPLISEGNITTESLMKHFNMAYPATLIFIEWYRDDPTTAMSSLESGGLLQ